MGRKMEGPLQETRGPTKVLRVERPAPRKRSIGERALYFGGCAGLGFFAVNALATAALCVGGIVALTALTGRFEK